MTKDEIEHMWKVASNNPNHDSNWHDPVVVKFAKLVAEKAIKESLAQTQEPVNKLRGPTSERAWFTIAELNAWADKKLAENPNWVMPKDEPERDEPPPQRTWVDLTRAQFAEILCDDRWQGRPELMLLQAQSKLKEKNT